MDTQIFREYDIRGQYPEELNADVARTIGRSFASYIEDKTVIIGHDNRLSSPIINEYLIKGLMECGANIIDLDLCSTPMYHVIKKHLKIKNGIMVTASHNPKIYNGFKISFSYYGNAYGEQIVDFKNFTLSENFTYLNNGTYEKLENKEAIYLNYIKNGISLGNKRLKVIFDMGSSTPSIIVKDVLDMFNIDYTILFGESDGNFPYHHPDPFEKENLKFLQEEVIKQNADIGIGIDGDGDRFGVVDNNGNIIDMDKIMTIIYKDMFTSMKKKEAIVGIKCSNLVKEELNKIGLPTKYYKISSYLNHKINSEGYDFGGELSGHVWFNDRYPGVDDGIYAGLRLIEILSKNDEKLSQMVSKLPIYVTSDEIKIPCKEENKELIINKLKEYHDNKGILYNDVDGLRVEYPDGFALVRKSNTSPYLTTRFEKKTKEETEKLQKEYLELIEKISLEFN